MYILIRSFVINLPGLLTSPKIFGAVTTRVAGETERKMDSKRQYTEEEIIWELRDAEELAS
jgi:hypothetical protein